MMKNYQKAEASLPCKVSAAMVFSERGIHKDILILDLPQGGFSDGPRTKISKDLICH
jgi:hypothetical protein